MTVITTKARENCCRTPHDYAVDTILPGNGTTWKEVAQYLSRFHKKQIDVESKHCNPNTCPLIIWLTLEPILENLDK